MKIACWIMGTILVLICLCGMFECQHRQDVKHLRVLHPEWTPEQVDAAATLLETHNNYVGN